MTRMKHCTMILAGMCGLVLTSSAFAQVNRQPVGRAPAAEQPAQAAKPYTARRPVQSEPMPDLSDPEVAAMLLIDAQSEVNIGRFAQSHASSERAKKLAQEMVEDHTKTVETLQRLAGAYAHAAMAQPEQEQRETGHGVPLIVAKKQIADECAAWLEKELSQKQGADFDRAFAGSQMGKHMEVICVERVLRQYVSADLRKAIDEELKHAEHHYSLAKEIIEEHSSSQSSGPASGRSK